MRSINGLGLNVVQDDENGREIEFSTHDNVKRYNLIWFYGLTRDFTQDFKNYWLNVANNLHKNNHNIKEAVGDEAVTVSDVYTVIINFPNLT